MRSRLGRPSPSLVISIVALFVAMGGTSYAAITITGKNVKNSSLTGADIKNSSIAGADVKDKSLTPKDFSGSVTGPKGATGATGATGAQGPKGAAGTNGINGTNSATNVIARTATGPTVASGSASAVTVNCQAGERATGGGGYLTFASVQPSMVRSYPSDPGSEGAVSNGTTPRAWTTIINNTSGGNSEVRGYVICVSP